jgi:hypothetical protein
MYVNAPKEPGNEGITYTYTPPQEVYGPPLGTPASEIHLTPAEQLPDVSPEAVAKWQSQFNQPY